MLMFGSNSNDGAITAPVFEGYDAEAGGDKVALVEAQQDYVAIFEAMHAMDMTHIQPEAVCEAFGGGDLDTVKESLAKNAFDKIKTFFSNLWGKLKAFFASAVRLLDAITKDGKAFAEKYQTEIRGLKVDGMEYKMHEYTNLEGGALATGSSKDVDALFAELNKMVSAGDDEAVRAAIQQVRDDNEDHIEGLRGKVVGKSALTAQEFSVALYGHFRNGADNKKDLDDVKVNITAILATLKDSAPKKTAEDLGKKVDKEFNGILSELKKIESKLNSAKPKDGAVNAETAKGNKVATSEKLTGAAVQYAQVLAGRVSAEQKIQSDAFTAWRSAIDERSRVYKSVVLAAFRYAGKKAKKKD